MPLLLELADDALRNVASFLCAPDLLHFLSTHPHLFQLSKSESFWRALNGDDERDDGNNNQHDNNNNINPQQQEQQQQQDHTAMLLQAKRAYLTRAYAYAMPMVQWKPCRSSRQSPTGREGHMAVTMGKRIIITGGFTDDERVYVLDTSNCNGTSAQDWIQVMPTQVQSFRHKELPPVPPAVAAAQRRHHHHGAGMVPPEGDAPLASVYGATLTALDDHRAIRFGGFRGGGYTGECNEIALLTISEQQQDNNDNDNTGNDNTEQHPPTLTATWQVIFPKNFCVARAYHSATLVSGRFLVVLGGMSQTGCIRSESILDTHTWTWLHQGNNIHNLGPVTQEMKLPKPTGRHGHSAILDEKRDRIVVFGGGSGTDLLRSGRDNAEVWQLRMGAPWSKPPSNLEELKASLPWEWAPISMNSGDEEDEEDEEEERLVDNNNMPGMDGGDNDNNNDNDDDDEDFHSAHGSENENDSEDDDDSEPPPLMMRPDGNDRGGAVQDNTQRNAQRRSNRLTDVEKLCLGRCHLGFKVGPDTAILAFGSGRPSTNGVLGFCLATDSFIRPQISSQQGQRRVLPCPRFTCAGAMFGDNNSYMLVHGGYSTQEGMAIGNMCVLDLAPALQRPFTALPENPDVFNYQPVTQEDINRHSAFGGHHFGLGGHGMGIGGMEDLLQNLFVEFAARGGGRAAPGGAIRLGGPGRNLGDLFGILAGGRPVRPDDEEDFDDEDLDDHDDDDEDLDEDGPDPDMLFNFVMRAADEEIDDDDDEEEENDNDSDAGYDSANISEVS